jgi:hypothetical protein
MTSRVDNGLFQSKAEISVSFAVLPLLTHSLRNRTAKPATRSDVAWLRSKPWQLKARVENHLMHLF